MSNLTEIQIIRAEVEGWEETLLGCYISCDNNLLDVITPINSEHDESRMQIPFESALRLIIKSMCESDEYIGSVSVSVSLLPSQGYVWLPLLSDISNDVLSSLPEQVELPRILVSISAPAIEQSVISENIEVQQLEVQFSKLMAVHSTCQKTVDLLKKEAEFERLRAQECESRLSSTKELLEAASHQATKTEESLLALLQQKDDHIAELQEQLKSFYKEQSGKVSVCGDSEDSTDLLKENNFLKDQLSQYKETVEELQQSLDNIGKEWQKCDPSKSASKIAAIKKELRSLQKQSKDYQRELQDKEQEILSLHESYKQEIFEMQNTYEKQMSSNKEKIEKESVQVKEEGKLMRKQLEADIKTLKDEYLILQNELDDQRTENIELNLSIKQLREEINYMQQKMDENTVDTLISTLELNDELVKSHDHFYVYKESLVDLEAIREKLYVGVQGHYIPYNEFVNKENQVLAPKNSTGRVLREPSVETKTLVENTNRITPSSSRRFLTSTLSSQSKIRVHDAPFQEKVRQRSTERRRPFK